MRLFFARTCAVLFAHRIIETLTCEICLLAWRFDPWLAQLEWLWFERSEGAGQAPERDTDAQPAVATHATNPQTGVHESALARGLGRPTLAANDEAQTTPAAVARSALSEAAFRWASARRLSMARPAIVAAVLALPALPYANHLVWSYRYPPDYWQKAASDMLRPPVYDAGGMLAGYVPRDDAPDDGAVYTVQPDAVPEACVDLVLLREDRHAGAGLRHALGVDWPRLARGLLTGRGGGSTLPMQLARQLSGWQTSMGTLSRKWREIGVAQALLEAHGGDYRTLASTYLATAPFAQYQGDVRGIAAAAEVLWGLRASQLSPAQCALLVTMLPVRVKLKADGERAEQQWAVRKRQAELLLREAYGDRAEPMVAELRASGTLPPRRTLIEALGPTATYNLDARTRRLVRPHLDRLVADLRWGAVKLAAETQARTPP